MKGARMIASWLDRALAFVYPNVCQLCHAQESGAPEGFVCDACSRGVRFIQPPFCERCGLPFEGDITTSFECANCRELDLHFESARSAVLARGVVLEAIHRYKYQRALWFEPFLASLLVRQAAPALDPREWDAIVPVPLHATKERHREFNQARTIAAHLARATGIPLRGNLLKRVRATTTQTLLTREERTRNVRHAFALRRGARAEGLRCVVVDDVFTTGATTSGCAGALAAAGARRVCVWTVARGV